jgi:hypothetical protein
VHETYSASPRLELKNYVRAFAQRRLEQDSAALVEPVPACLEQIFNFEFGIRPIGELGDARRFTLNRLSIVGASAYRPFNMHLYGGVESFAIFFLAFWQLFGLPIGSFVNQHYEGYAVLGCEADQLWNRLAEAVTFAERVKTCRRLSAPEGTECWKKELNHECSTLYISSEGCFAIGSRC